MSVSSAFLLTRRTLECTKTTVLNNCSIQTVILCFQWEERVIQRTWCLQVDSKNMERYCWIERFWPGSHTGVLGWSGSLVGTFVGTDVSGREDESSSVFCGLFYMNVDQVSLRSGCGLHAPDFIVYQAAWGSQWSRSLTRSFPALVLVSIRSGLGSRFYHDNESINNVLNTDSFQCWLSACICVSRILKTGCKSGSFLHPAGKILYCFTGKQDWSSNRKARESVRFPGHKNSNILPWRPFDFILSQVTKPGLCVLKYDISSCFALYFVVCVPVKIDNKMKYFISKRIRL